MYLPLPFKKSFYDLRSGHRLFGPMGALGDKETRSPLVRAHGRLLFIASWFLVVFVVLGLRLVDVMGFSPMGMPQLWGDGDKFLENKRADIVDRNGVLLATNVKTSSVYANPYRIQNPKKLATDLAKILTSSSEDEIYQKVTSGKKFVWLARNLSPQKQMQIHRLGNPALGFHQEEKRIYPHGKLMAHVLGFTNVDNKGMGGVEHHFNQNLTSAQTPLQLSLDVRLQHVLYNELQASMSQFDAPGGAGILMNAKTGEILALVSLPDFDPHHPQKIDQKARFNMATLGVYEMGSVMKLFNVAMALENGIGLSKTYDASSPIKVARFQIKDYKIRNENKIFNVPEGFILSSNICAAKMALEVGIEKQKEFMSRLGLSSKPTLELPEIGRPLLPTPWRQINLMTISYGYGMSMSPLQVVSALASLMNGGTFHQATLLKKEGFMGGKVDGVRVLSEENSLTVRKLLRLVITHGTGKKAAAEGYLVGGKTGSAHVQMAGRKGYNTKENIATYVAAFPMNDPECVLFILLDRPKGRKETYGNTTAGWTVAPMVSRIVSRVAPILGIAPVQEQKEVFTNLLAVPGFSLDA